MGVVLLANMIDGNTNTASTEKNGENDEEPVQGANWAWGTLHDDAE
jgi:hypothetical protein